MDQFAIRCWTKCSWRQACRGTATRGSASTERRWMQWRTWDHPRARPRPPATECLAGAGSRSWSGSIWTRRPWMIRWRTVWRLRLRRWCEVLGRRTTPPGRDSYESVETKINQFQACNPASTMGEVKFSHLGLFSHLKATPVVVGSL